MTLARRTPPPVTSTLPSSSSVAVCNSRAVTMFPVAVHAEAALPAGVENVEAEASAPLLEFADGDAPMHPLTASSKAAPATVAANRGVVLFSRTNDRVYSGTAA